MNLEGLTQVVKEVFGNVSVEVINGWLSMQCVLAPWTHESGKDSKKSAGMSIHENSVSVFSCFTCGNKMPIHGMLRKYAGYTGEDLDDLIEELEEQAYLGPREMPEWGESRHAAVDDPVALKESVYLGLYDSACGHPYLEERGVSSSTAAKLQLMVDPCDPADGEERILFPVFGPNGDLYGLSGRAINPSARLKVRDYFGLKKAACLLGAHLITTDKPKKVLVVEGLFDYARGWECGQPVVAVMHSTMTERQANILRDFSLPVYAFYDDDAAGDKGVKSAGGQLYNYVPVMKVRYPEIWVGDEENGHWVKDPGELEREDFEAMITDARLWSPWD